MLEIGQKYVGRTPAYPHRHKIFKGCAHAADPLEGFRKVVSTTSEMKHRIKKYLTLLKNTAYLNLSRLILFRTEFYNGEYAFS